LGVSKTRGHNLFVCMSRLEIPGIVASKSCRIPVVPYLFFVLLLAAANAHGWTILTTGLDTNLRSIDVIDFPHRDSARSAAIWASGSNGIILQSLDLGITWKRLHVSDGDSLDFRGIRAFDASTAYAISSGEGEKSRIYKTTDGGQTWRMQYTGARPAIFLDAIVCVSRRECIVLSDPVEGKFVLLRTADGEHWTELTSESMPAAARGEGAFAASNTALAICGNEIYFGTGGSHAARVFHSSNEMRSWRVSETPLAAGNASSGIFSIACSSSSVVAVGGDYKNQSSSKAVAAYSTDRGVTWHLASEQPGGYRSAVTSVAGDVFIAAGPDGEDITSDSGARWVRFNSLNLNAVSVLKGKSILAAGPHGTIARLVTP
jgi:photosystem II stability/assembly factor-like uncharacterized protein